MGYLLLFQSRGLMRARDFAAQFEISERTVYRDIQALCEVGVPIAAMPGEGYQLLDGYYLPPVTFSTEEARALFLAISMLSGFACEGETQTAAAAALDKIRAILPQATLSELEALQAVIHFYAFPGPALDFDDPTFLRLQEAIHQRRVVHLRYHAQHTNEVTERDVEPLNLLYFNKTWLLAAYCRLRRASRVFRLDRIDRLTVRPETFERQEWDEGERDGRWKWWCVLINLSYAGCRNGSTLALRPRGMSKRWSTTRAVLTRLKAGCSVGVIKWSCWSRLN